MPYDHDYVCMMKQPVLCELCNKSYAIGVMKKHKQSKMHIENAKNHGVPSSWWFVGGTKPDAFVSLRNQPSTLLSARLKVWTFNPFLNTLKIPPSKAWLKSI